MLQNAGSQPLTFAGSTPPAAPFSVTGVPAAGATLAAGAAVTATVTFAPTTAGTFVEHARRQQRRRQRRRSRSSRTAGAAPLLLITPLTIDFGQVADGHGAA